MATGSLRQGDAQTPAPTSVGYDAIGDGVRWLTDQERDAWLSAAALMIRLPAALDAQLQRDSELSFFEYMVMAVLSNEPEMTMRMSELAQATSSSLSRLSHTAARMEKHGYLQRTRCPGAGRRTNATLTDEGFAKVAQAAPGHVTTVRSLLIDALSTAELKTLHEIGRRVLDRTNPDGTASRRDRVCGSQ